MTITTERAAALEIAERAIQGVIGNDPEALRAVVHPDALNHESAAEPPDTRGLGADAFAATGAWLAAAFSELKWTTEEQICDGDLVVTYGRMSGRHTGDFVVWTEEGTVERAFPATGKTFSTQQAHFQRVYDGLVIEHWAVRDDQGMAVELGWVPPTIGYLIRCQRATARHRRAAQSAIA
ncbi:ester cyclase [Microbacterium sp.]|uniref:ester cyclase n=1 Tax=Microbacterium sp. TaxID=51671 RepID=UPI003C76D7FA